MLETERPEGPSHTPTQLVRSNVSIIAHCNNILSVYGQFKGTVRFQILCKAALSAKPLPLQSRSLTFYRTNSSVNSILLPASALLGVAGTPLAFAPEDASLPTHRSHLGTCCFGLLSQVTVAKSLDNSLIYNFGLLKNRNLADYFRTFFPKESNQGQRKSL